MFTHFLKAISVNQVCAHKGMYQNILTSVLHIFQGQHYGTEYNNKLCLKLKLSLVTKNLKQ